MEICVKPDVFSFQFIAIAFMRINLINLTQQKLFVVANTLWSEGSRELKLHEKQTLLQTEAKDGGHGLCHCFLHSHLL